MKNKLKYLYIMIFLSIIVFIFRFIGDEVFYGFWTRIISLVLLSIICLIAVIIGIMALKSLGDDTQSEGVE